MSIIPSGYHATLTVKETEKAIKLIKDHFQVAFAKRLNLTRVSAPLFVAVNTGLNDNLSGKEKAVDFTIPAIDDLHCEIVHSLAKWKRMALYKYDFKIDEGIYTDMNAIRRQEEELDNIHSVYVDQWDWEMIISKAQHDKKFLHQVVKEIYTVIYDTANFVADKYKQLTNFLPPMLSFVTTQELEDMYPDLTPDEREAEISKKYGAVFVENIGCKLNSGIRHGMRAPDYDDWRLNGDIIVWYPVLNRPVELSSMGIRVDSESLKYQMEDVGNKNLTEYHKNILNDTYPFTIGGGIGQSRLCQVMLHKAHIGEVQASIWPKATVEECLEKGVELL